MFSTLQGLLQFMGLKVLSYTSELGAEERMALIGKFNDPNERVDVAILSVQFYILGLNMHGACHNGVALCFAQNPSVLAQALCRIHRIGQKKIVRWWVFKQVGSYHEVQELNLHTKQAAFNSAQALIPWFINGDLRQILCFELAREMWGTMESKYVWKKCEGEFKTIQDWHRPWLRRYVLSPSSQSRSITSSSLVGHKTNSNGIYLATQNTTQWSHPCISRPCRLSTRNPDPQLKPIKPSFGDSSYSQRSFVFSCSFRNRAEILTKRWTRISTQAPSLGNVS